MIITLAEGIGILIARRRRERTQVERGKREPEPPDLQDEEEEEPQLEPPPPPESATTVGLPVEGRISSGFGMRRHPVTGKKQPHKGVDIAAKLGTPIVAVAAGKVTHSGRMGTYGITVIIDHGNREETLYAHMQSTAVARGDKVEAGDVIGKVGATGRVTGPHLHWEVRVKGEQVNPMASL